MEWLLKVSDGNVENVSLSFNSTLPHALDLPLSKETNSAHRSTIEGSRSHCKDQTVDRKLENH